MESQITEDRIDVALSCRPYSAIVDAIKDCKKVLVLGGKTSRGLFSLNNLDGDVRIINIPLLTSVAALKQHAPSVDIENDIPTHITVPGGATLDVVNEYLREKYPGYAVYFDITTSASSSLAGNFATGALGDNRLALPVTALEMLMPDGSVLWVDDMEIIEALRATQGYSAVFTKLKLSLRKIPPREELLVVNLDGESHRKTFTESLPTLIAKLYPYLRKRDEDRIWIDGMEILDKTGLSTIIRVSGNNPETLLKECLQKMGEKSVTSILLRVRHSEDTNLQDSTSDNAKTFLKSLEDLLDPSLWQISCIYNLLNSIYEDCDDDKVFYEELEAYIMSAYTRIFGEYFTHIDRIDVCKFKNFVIKNVNNFYSFLSEEDRILFDEIIHIWEGENPSRDESYCLRSIDFISDPDRILDYRALREMVPAMRREERVASGSTDRDIRLTFLEAPESGDMDAVRAAVRIAVRRVMSVFLDINESVQGLHPMFNGHMLFVPPIFSDSQESQFNGGANCHYALSAADDSDSSRKCVDRILQDLSARLSDLHGIVVNGVLTLEVTPGEKHYPPLKLKWIKEFLHFFENYEDLAIKQIAMIYLFGENTAFNFRAPDYFSILEDAGYNGVREKVNLIIAYFKNKLGIN